MVVQVKSKSASPEAAPKKSASSFLMTGAEAQKALKEDEAKAEIYASEKDKPKRFWISKDKKGEDFRITFLDGNLDDDGLIQCPVWKEHFIMFGGKYQNIVAPKDEQDPIEESNGKEASIVVGLSVIDHTPHEWNGKTYQNQRKMFVCKRSTLKTLNKIAAKHGGLAGCTFDVSRINEKSASVGEIFEFVQKSSLADLATQFGANVAKPINYAEELVFRSRDELIKMGFGNGGGKTISSVGVQSSDDEAALADEI